MARVWLNSETFGHGIAVAPISAWLLWRDRDRWLRALPGVSAWGLILVLPGAGAWLVAELAGVRVVAQYGLLSLSLGLVWCALGTAVIRRMVFPLAFLLFMVPAGESLNAPLMEATATATIAALRAVGLPVFREGMLFTLPTGNWSVVEACSGLRYVLAASMLGALFAWLNFQAWQRRLVFFVAAIVLALVANWARAWLVVMIGHLSHMRYGTGEDHVWYGWAFFGVVMAGLFWMGGRWRDLPSDPAPDQEISGITIAAHGAGGQATGGMVVPAVAKGPSGIGEAAVSLAFALLLLLIAVLPWLQAHLTEVEPRKGFEARVWNALGIPIQDVFTKGPLAAPPQIVGARAIVQGSLELSEPVGMRIEFANAYFADQTEGHEMIATGNHPFPDRRVSGWSVVRAGKMGSAETGLSHAVREHLLARGSERRLVWSWYSIGGRTAASEVEGKAMTAWSLLQGQGDHACMLVIGVALELTDQRKADQAGLTQAREHLARLGRRLPCD